MATSNRLTEYSIECPSILLPEENFFANQTLQVIKRNQNITKMQKLPEVSQTIHTDMCLQ